MRRIRNVIPTKDFRLILEFDNDDCRIFDMKPLIKRGGVFDEIADFNVFKTVQIDHDTVVWLDDIDLCPDTLYQKSKPIEEGSEEAM